MRYIFTAEELIDQCVWDEFCQDRRINVWAVNEGLMNSDEEFVLNDDEISKYGLVVHENIKKVEPSQIFIVYKDFDRDKFLLTIYDPDNLPERVLAVCNNNGKMREDTFLPMFVEFTDEESCLAFKGTILKETITDYFHDVENDYEDTNVTTTFYGEVYFE